MRIIQKDPTRDLNASKPFAITKKFRNGVTMVEVAVAVLIMIISLLGVSTAYVSGKKQILKQAQYQQAVNLAGEKLEEIRAQGYDSLEVTNPEDVYYKDDDDNDDYEQIAEKQDSNKESLSLFGLSCTRTTTARLTAKPTEDVPNPCKEVTVSVKWTGLASDEHEVKLMTYIGP